MKKEKDSLVTDSKSSYLILVVLFCSKMNTWLNIFFITVFVYFIIVFEIFVVILVEFLSMALDMFMYLL